MFLSGADGCADFAGEVAVGVASRSFLLVMSPSEWFHWPLLGRRPWPTLLVR